MTTYGILLVDPSWSNENTVQIEKAAFMRYSEFLGTYTMALIYMRAPVDAIVAEAEITSNVIETEAELVDHADFPMNRDTQQFQTATEVSEHEPSLRMAHDFHVPLRLIRIKGDQTPPIPLSRLKSILGANFSVYDETWIPLSEDQYNEIIALWGV